MAGAWAQFCLRRDQALPFLAPNWRGVGFCLRGLWRLWFRDDDEGAGLGVRAEEGRAAEVGGGESQLPCGGLELGHGFCGEELAALAGGPAGPGFGFFAASAVGGDAGAGVHLAVELG